MTERRSYQLSLRRQAPAILLWGVAVDEQQGSRGGFYLAGQGYSDADCAAVYAWMIERSNRYPRRPALKQYSTRPGAWK
jgi:hypothetical protein